MDEHKKEECARRGHPMQREGSCPCGGRVIVDFAEIATSD